MSTRTKQHSYTADDGQSLVASITSYEGNTVEIGHRQTREWQELAWAYWGRLGELMDPTTQQANLVGRLQWNVVVDGKQLERSNQDNTPDEVDDYLAQVTEGVGRIEALRLLTLNVQVAGECWYCYHGSSSRIYDNDGRGDKPARAGWNVYAITEPKLRERIEEAEFALRVKVDDPRDQEFAISRFSTVIDPAEELITLRALSRSQSKSRLAQAGILFRPSEAQFPPKEHGEEGEDIFGDMLEEVTTAAITDERSPMAHVPIDVRVKGDLIEKFKHMMFERPYDERIHSKIEAAIQGIAIALDIPADLLKGISTVNHWTAWLLEESNYQAHVNPLAAFVGDVLAVAGQKLGIGKTIEVTPDASELLARRSTVQDAFRSVELGAVGLRYLREVIGATEADIPTDDEVALQVLLRRGFVVRGTDISDAIRGTPVKPGTKPIAPDVPTDPSQPGPPSPGEQPRGSGRRRPRTPGPGGPGPSPVSPGPRGKGGRPVGSALGGFAIGSGIDPSDATNDELDTLGTQLADIDFTLISQLSGAMDMAIDTARNRVGAKVRSAIRMTKLHDEIADVTNSDVVSRLGAGKADEVVDNLDDVVRVSLQPLAMWWDKRCTDAIRAAGRVANVDTSTPVWVEHANRSRTELVENLTTWIVAHIARSDNDLPATPIDVARNVVAVLGGSTSEPPLIGIA
jgi:hypothetical protein